MNGYDISRNNRYDEYRFKYDEYGNSVGDIIFNFIDEGPSDIVVDESTWCRQNCCHCSYLAGLEDTHCRDCEQIRED